MAELVDEAKRAAKEGDFAKSVASCDKAIQIRPGHQDASTVCGIAACNLKDAARAGKYLKPLSTSRGNMVRQICLRNGVKVD